MMTIREAAKLCKDRVTEFPLNEESIARKLYAGSAAGSIKTTQYVPQFGKETTVIESDELEKFIRSEAFDHLIAVQRKKYEKKMSLNNIPNKTNNGTITRTDRPITGDIYIAPEGAGFNPNSILLVTRAGNNNVLMEEISTDKAREINNGEIVTPCCFARSINEVNQYNYYGNSYNMSVVANKIANNCDF